MGLRKSRLTAWIFVGPAIALFAVFFAYPLVASLVQSFQTDDRGETVWAGFDNYSRLFGDELFGKSLINTGLILIVQVPVMTVLALIVAQILNQSWLKLRSGYRIAYFLPAVTTLVAYAIVFRVLLRADNGVMNHLLGYLGVAPIDWLHDPFWAKVALIASITWRWTGYNMVIILAGLQSIPKEQYEAASVDGAGALTTYVKVIVPQLRPVILFCLITSTIGTLQLFDEPYLLTQGGPDNATLTPLVHLYKIGFEQLDFGYASAIAWAVVAIIGVLSFVQFKFLGRRE
ncbi:lactose ABC transporter permease [Actinorhabdospora filicis]|uniref:Lactose ABC transporter permease n=2 Tax=Actinorhabdospora filicis TaxID=1785913 RepID=A0A9W6W7I2_9ACTN|nr:lactose ABC transporter permease [Actinorhabdospora filicis]